MLPSLTGYSIAGFLMAGTVISFAGYSQYLFVTEVFAEVQTEGEPARVGKPHIQLIALGGAIGTGLF